MFNNDNDDDGGDDYSNVEDIVDSRKRTKWKRIFNNYSPKTKW